MGLLIAYVLYHQYSTNRVKIPLRAFQEEIADCLIYYNEEEWDDSGYGILHAPSLPVDERYDDPPVVAPASSSAMPGPSSTMPATSSDLQAVYSSFSEEESTDDLGVPQLCCPYSQNIVDHLDHLISGPNHVAECLGHLNQQRRCQVCYMNSKRRDTCFQCAHCKIALCLLRD